MSVVSSKRLYLTADGEVTEDEEVAATLLVGAGGTLSDELAERYGVKGEPAPVYDASAEHERLHADDAGPASDVEEKAVLRRDTKAVAKAPANKSAKE